MENRLTISKEAHLKGIGLHSGKAVSVKFKPAKVNTGIKFTRVDLPELSSIVLGYSQIEKLGGESRQTNLSKNGVKIKTIEHLMASLWALSIDDIEIDLDQEEFPIMDGSSLEILHTLKGAGLEDLGLTKKTLDIKEPLFCEADSASIAAFPNSFLKVSYLLSFEKFDVAPQYLSISFNNPAEKLGIFERELAGARTFCFESEVETILKRGLGKGGNCDNGLVIGKDGNIIKNKLRFKDEFVRHKLADLIGDLFMLGIPVKGNFVAVKSGHSLNFKMVEKISSLISVNTSKVAAIPLKAMDFSKKELDINDIRKILPHRYPFLLIDRIIEIDKDKRIVGLKNVTANENFFEGHFPGMPVMPGVLMIEAMAQVGGLLLLNRPENIGKLAFFMSIDKAKFRKPVIPGDQLIIEVEFIKARSRIAQVRAKATVKGELVSEAELMFGVAPTE